MELNKLNNEYEQKIQEMVEELNNKGMLVNKLNTLNNEHKQKI